MSGEWTTPIPSNSVPEPEATNMQVEESHTFTYSSTLALIQSVETHFEDLSHPMKRKLAYNNIANDMISMGYTVTVLQCQSKWKSLVRSYKTAKDNKLKTGKGPSRFNFYLEMDSILREDPTNYGYTHNMDNSVMIKVEEPEIPTSSNTISEPPSELQRQTEPMEHLIKLIEEKERNKAARHKERMDIEKAKLELLQQLLDK